MQTPERSLEKLLGKNRGLSDWQHQVPFSAPLLSFFPYLSGSNILPFLRMLAARNDAEVSDGLLILFIV
jgi:hypothetical protein